MKFLVTTWLTAVLATTAAVAVGAQDKPDVPQPPNPDAQDDKPDAPEPPHKPDDQDKPEHLPDGDDLPPNSIKFKHFIALHDNQTCLGDSHARPFNNQIRGVNLGGWMVLEPWITPSLFYQFLGGNETTTAMDMYTFCQVLGPTEANRQLRQHWATWVTKDIIRELAESGAVNSLRLPVGDFMYKPYGPYAGGCVDGALEMVDEVLDWAYSNGLSVLIDIHTAKGSQNGFDNSGMSAGLQWTTKLNSDFGGTARTFEHWPIRSANWVGKFDPETATYPIIYHDNIQHSLDVIQEIVDRYAGHPAVLGLEPVNEPWQFTPIDVLKDFYWKGYLIVKKSAPYWKYVMHDSFRASVDTWGGFMKGCPDRALDTHIYQAWRDPDSRIGYYNDACATKGKIAELEREFGPVVVGEWSLATDNCVMWLNGFNDNLPGFPRLPCKYIKCSDPYMGEDQPGAPVDPSKPIQGPYGTGMSGPSFGYCPVSRDWYRESSGNPQTGRDWVRAPPNAPKHLDDTDHVMTHLANKKINSFSGVGHGFYFWNFRTDLYDPQWSYMAALERGWIPKGNLNADSINNACHHEDNGDFTCIVRKDAPEGALHDAIGYILQAENTTSPEERKAILDKKGDEFRDEASTLISDYFKKNRHMGATCDFGGVAILTEQNSTDAGDDDFTLSFDDDEYLKEYIEVGLKTWQVIVLILLGILFGLIIGFIVAMRTSKKFNKRVRESVMFRPLSTTKSRIVRSSLALPELADYEEIENHTD